MRHSHGNEAMEKASVKIYLKKTNLSLMNIKSEILIVMTVRKVISWDVAACSLVDVYRHIGGKF
jgi:hypothetical protein